MRRDRCRTDPWTSARRRRGVCTGQLAGARTVACLALVAVMSVYAAEIHLLSFASPVAEQGCGCSAHCSCRRGDDQRCTCASEGLRMTAACGCGGGGSVADVPTPLSAICTEPTGVRRSERTSQVRVELPAVPDPGTPNAPEPPP